MTVHVKYHPIGLKDYKEVWKYQEEIHKEMMQAKLSDKNKGKDVLNHLIICQHPHVYTLGKSGKVNNLLIADDFLEKIEATFCKTDRGGDITYHGPGQIVGYPIFDLDAFQLSVKKYVFMLEEAIIKTLDDYNIKGTRLENATGVWLLPKDKKNTRKMCAIGVKVSRGITMHGFALNVNTNLNYFNYIHPCGFVDKGVTSLNQELGSGLVIEQVQEKLLLNLSSIFNFELRD